MLTIGQKLWLVPRQGYGQPREAKVIKVGRKWAVVESGPCRKRVDVETLEVASGGFYPSGYCYLSRKEYDTELNKVWEDFCHRLTHSPPPRGATIENIKDIRREWGI